MRLLRLLFRLIAPPRRRRERNSEQSQSAEVIILSRTETRMTAVVSPPPPPQVIQGRCWVVDGDTIVINDTSIRLAGIDAPELDHPWGKRAKWAMVELCKGQVITARIKPEQSYDRLVAECTLPDGRDLAAELVKAGLALDWPKFSGGKYRHLETTDARKRLWRADARQRGKMVPGSGRSTPR